MARIDELIDWIAKFQMEEINTVLRNYRKPEGSGTLEVPQIKPQVEQMREIFKLITPSRVSSLPPFKQGDLVNFLEPIIQNLDRLHTLAKDNNQSDENQQKTFTYFFHGGGPSDQDRYNYKVNQLWPIIADSMITELVQNYGDKVREIDGSLERAKKIETSLEQIHKSVSEKEQKETVATHAKVFSDQADKHTNMAKNWRTASLWLLAVDLAIIISSFIASFYVSDSNKIELGIFAALTISLVSFTIVLSVKNFFSERHNETINRHKANCLSSFETFIATASDPVRDTILQYTAQTIFSPYNPGYLSKDAMQSPLPIIELLRTVYPEKK